MCCSRPLLLNTYAEDTLLSLHAQRSLSLHWRVSSARTLSRSHGHPRRSIAYWKVNTTALHLTSDLKASAVPLSCRHVWTKELQPQCGPPLEPDDTRHSMELLEGMTRTITLLSLRLHFLALRPRLAEALCLQHTCEGRGGSCGLVKAVLSCYVRYHYFLSRLVSSAVGAG